MIKLWISLVLLVVGGICKGLMDLYEDGKLRPSKADTSHRKYKQPQEPPNRWAYGKLYRPAYKEAFPLSSTFLVGLTDPWHRYQTIFLISKYINLGLWIHLTGFWFIDAFIFSLIEIGIVFNLVYHYRQIFRNEKNKS